MARKQTVSLKGEDPVSVIRNTQKLSVVPHAHRPVHRLVSNLYSDARLKQSEKSFYQL